MSGMDPVLVNVLYAVLGAGLGLVATWMTSRLLLSLLGFELRDELKAGNVAVGLAMLGAFVGAGLCMGLIIGMALN